MTNWRLQHMPALLTASGILLAGAAAVGAALAGPVGAAGAAAGVGIVSLSYTVSTLVIAKADEIDPKLILPWGIGTYIVKISLIGVMMAAIASAGWPGLVPLGWGVIVGVVGWTGTHIWWINAIYRPPALDSNGRPVADQSSPSGPEQE
jgi:hypothetical protein